MMIATVTQPDSSACCSQFVTNSDRLVQLLIEEAMGHLPAKEVTIETPCGPYQGVMLPDESSLCAVSILRAADCMLGVVRSTMPSIKVGKVLIQRDEETALPVLMYAKLPPDIAACPAVLLVDPSERRERSNSGAQQNARLVISCNVLQAPTALRNVSHVVPHRAPLAVLATGGSAVMCIKVLVERGVEPKNIIFVNVVCCKEGLEAIAAAYPEVLVVTGAVDPILNEKK